MFHNDDLYTAYKNYANAALQGSDELKPAAERLAEIFAEALANECSAFFTGTSKAHALYRLKNEVTECESLLNSLIALFVKIPDYYDKEIESLISTSSGEIINGIRDTLSIKVQSLEESLAYLYDTEERTAASFAGQIPELTIDIISELLPYLTGGINGDVLKSESEIKAAVSAAAESEYFKEFCEKRKKLYSALSETITKKINAFKRDYLLFEVSSFEEIMSYSVSKINQSGESAALAFAAFCESVYNDVIEVLRRFGFELITPRPGDMFNGREHEILQAEANRGFKKGEIIKCVTCGYRTVDTVIMRANVIAAR